jgi:hypothetical protein
MPDFYAGSPIPAFLTTLQRGDEESILSLLCFNLLRDEHSNHSYSGEKAHASLFECFGNYLLRRMSFRQIGFN